MARKSPKPGKVVPPESVAVRESAGAKRRLFGAAALISFLVLVIAAALAARSARYTDETTWDGGPFFCLNSVPLWQI